MLFLFLKYATLVVKGGGKRMKRNKQWGIYGLTFGSILGATFLQPKEVNADAWQVNSVADIASRIDETSRSLTMIEGDTIWNIGVALNIKHPMQLLANNGYQNGEQYTLPVGTVISWDGNYVMVTDGQNEVIGEQVVTNNEKMNPEQTIANQTSDEPQTEEIKAKIAAQQAKVSEAREKLAASTTQQTAETTTERVSANPTKKQELATSLSEKKAELANLNEEIQTAQEILETSEEFDAQAKAQQTVAEADVKRQRLETEITILESEYAAASDLDVATNQTSEIKRQTYQQTILEQDQILQTLQEELRQQTVIEVEQAQADVSAILTKTATVIADNQVLDAVSEQLRQKKEQQTDLTEQLEQAQQTYQAAQKAYNNWLDTMIPNTEGEQLATTLAETEKQKDTMYERFVTELLDFDALRVALFDLATQLKTYPQTSQLEDIHQEITETIQRYE